MVIKSNEHRGVTLNFSHFRNVECHLMALANKKFSKIAKIFCLRNDFNQEKKIDCAVNWLKFS